MDSSLLATTNYTNNLLISPASAYDCPVSLLIPVS